MFDASEGNPFLPSGLSVYSVDFVFCETSDLGKVFDEFLVALSIDWVRHSRRMRGVSPWKSTILVEEGLEGDFDEKCALGKLYG